MTDTTAEPTSDLLSFWTTFTSDDITSGTHALAASATHS